MLPTKDFFYGQTEPVWILRSEKKGDGKKGDDDSKESTSKKGAEKAQYPIWPIVHAVTPYPPYQLAYNPEYNPTPAKKDPDAKAKSISDSAAGKETKNKEAKVVLKVPMCCSECEDLIKVALYGLTGVKSVECRSHNEKVTVVATTAAADILLACRKIFKKSRMWSDDD